MHRFSITLALSTLLLVPICSGQQTSTTAVPNLIRYGGTLKDASATATSSATVGVTFAIYKQQEGGAPVWQETQNVVTDANGNYSVLLGGTTATGLPSDLFSQQEQRWLGVQVQGQPEQPRVLLVSVPYAMKAAEADKLSGHSASEFVTADNLQDAVKKQVQQQTAVVTAAGPAVAPGGAYIDNGTTLQVGANFNIDGSGSAATFNATSVYKLAGAPVLGNTGTQGLFLGPGAGQINSGSYNTFLGLLAGRYNTTASNNTFVGWSAGRNNSTGYADVFIGMQAGYHNTTGTANNFLGYSAGFNNTTGSANTFLGHSAGFSNTTGRANFFLGYAAGLNNTTGSQNSFLGVNAGLANTTGHDNFFLGLNAGWVNTTGNGNTFIGNTAGQAVVTGSNNTFLGYGAGSSAGAAASNDVYISNRGVASDNGVIRIGDPGNQTKAYLAGIYGNSPSGAQPVVINSGGQLGTSLQVPAGSPNYIQNGTTLQTGANFNIDGNGTVGGNLTVTGFGNLTVGSFFPFSVTSSGFVSTTNISVNANVFSGGPSLALAANGSDDSNLGFGGNGAQLTGGNGFTQGINGTGGAGLYAEGGSGDVAGGVGGSFTGGDAGSAGDSSQAGDGIDAIGGYSDMFGFNAYAGNFNGNVNVSGALFASTKDFKIDHPLDPANKYLYHASVESSEMLNIYTGNVVLDGAGEAEVRMPDWLEAANTDFRYQLTSIGAPGPSLYIAKEIADGSFKIAGGQPGIKVSWQITAVRQDAYARANPLVVEQTKPERERGFFIHPELYGAPPEKGVEWARHPKLMETIKQMHAQSRQKAGRAKGDVSQAPGLTSSQ